ncbi:MAG: hypothetical protein LBN95_00165 [Prevotellaceae bacterium]|jgi:hypothetical protein|nr:hypothetical protein [Prevotellaceae bacterium]
MEEKNVSKLLDGLSKEQTLKLAEILAVMQKIADSEQEKVLPKVDLIEKSENIKTTLPEPPKTFILKTIRSRQEKKIDKQNGIIGGIKFKIAQQQDKQKNIKVQIDALKSKQQTFVDSNTFLSGLDLQNEKNNNLRNIAIQSNRKEENRLQKKIDKLETEYAKSTTKIGNFERQSDTSKSEISRLTDKINRIKEIQDFPNAALLLYLSDKVNMAEKLDFDIENMDKNVSEIAKKPSILFSDSEKFSNNISEFWESISEQQAELQIAENTTEQVFSALDESQISLQNEFENGEEIKANTETDKTEKVDISENISAENSNSEIPQFMPPPNFEYEQQPADAVPFVAPQSEKSNVAAPVMQKKNADLAQFDPNVKDPNNELSPQNANNSELPKIAENTTSEQSEPLSSISITKAKFEEIKPKLSELRGSGIALKATADNEKEGNVKIIFKSKDSEKIMLAIKSQAQSALAQ